MASVYREAFEVKKYISLKPRDLSQVLCRQDYTSYSFNMYEVSKLLIFSLKKLSFDYLDVTHMVSLKYFFQL